MKRTLRFEKQHRSKVNIHFLFIALMLMVCGWQDVAAKFVEPNGWLNYQGADSEGQWSADLKLPPGSHTLTATAHHPSGRFSPNTQSQFTVTSGSGVVNTTYDAAGQVTGRTFSDGRRQTLSWDGLGRLVSVSERDGANNGYNWTAVYTGSVVIFHLFPH